MSLGCDLSRTVVFAMKSSSSTEISYSFCYATDRVVYAVTIT